MPPLRIPRPDESEYAPYFHLYISKVPDGDLLEILERQAAETRALLGSVSESDARFRYAPDKWSIKEVVGHVGDTERIMTYRAVCFARGETTVLPAFDENAFVKAARFDDRPLSSLLAELGHVRTSTVAFFDGLSDDELVRRGRTPSGEYSVRALAYIIAGHECHHQRILRERYFAALRPGAAVGAH